MRWPGTRYSAWWACARWLSYGFGMTFGLCAYVQQRLGGHMMLAAVEFVPFSVLLCLWCAEDPNFNKPGKGFFKNKRNWLALAMAWGIANNGAAYYPYFTCFSSALRPSA